MESFVESRGFVNQDTDDRRPAMLITILVSESDEGDDRFSVRTRIDFSAGSNCRRGSVPMESSSPAVLVL